MRHTRALCASTYACVIGTYKRARAAAIQFQTLRPNAIKALCPPPAPATVMHVHMVRARKISKGRASLTAAADADADATAAVTCWALVYVRVYVGII